MQNKGTIMKSKSSKFFLSKLFIMILFGIGMIIVSSVKSIAAAKNGFVKEGNSWIYYVNGKASDKTDIVKGTVNKETGWWYIKNGKVQFVNSVEKNSNGWFYVKKGKVDFSFNGVAKNSYGYWYCKNGQVDFSHSGITKCTVKNKTGWWYIKGGQVLFIDSIGKNENGWFAVKNGLVDFSFTGIAKNEYGYFYCKNAKVDFSYENIIKATVNNVTGWWYVKNGEVKFITSIQKNENGWFYIKNGMVDFSFTGIAKNDYGYFYCKNAKVDFNYTGLGKNEYGLWYCKNGKVDFSYKGLVKYNNEIYYISGGKFQSDYSGYYTGKVNGVNGTYQIVKGKVSQNSGIVTINGKKNYINNGRVDKRYTGLQADKSGTYWYVENGIIDSKHTQVVKGRVKGVDAWWYVENSKVVYKTAVARNQYGLWFVKSGKVDFSFSGNFKYNNKIYRVESGRVVADIEEEKKMLKKAQNYGSSTSYLILVDKAQHKTMILKGSKNNWKELYYWDCNDGAPESETPTGEFTTALKILYFGEDDYRCWYATQFWGDYLFHSVLYEIDDAPKVITDGRMAMNTSHGCVRLNLENAKWMYDNIPEGTKVVIY